MLALLDFYPGSHTGSLTKIEPRPLVIWLAAQPGDGAVAMFSFGQVEEQINIYATVFHDKPFIGGLFNANQPPQYTYIKPIMDQFPSQQSIDLLRELGITYVVVDMSAYKEMTDIDSDLRSHGMRLATIQGQYRVYSVDSLQ